MNSQKLAQTLGINQYTTFELSPLFDKPNGAWTFSLNSKRYTTDSEGLGLYEVHETKPLTYTVIMPNDSFSLGSSKAVSKAVATNNLRRTLASAHPLYEDYLKSTQSKDNMKSAKAFMTYLSEMKHYDFI